MQIQTPQKPTNPWTQTDLDSANARYQHAQTDLQTFEQQIQGFPMYDWRPEIKKQHDALYRHLAQNATPSESNLESSECTRTRRESNQTG